MKYFLQETKAQKVEHLVWFKCLQILVDLGQLILLFQ